MTKFYPDETGRTVRALRIACGTILYYVLRKGNNVPKRQTVELNKIFIGHRGVLNGQYLEWMGLADICRIGTLKFSAGSLCRKCTKFYAFVKFSA